ncbi:MAG: D-amino-acid transaminase [Rickettsiales bacterium]|nr:D-amino-acid transaminase [Rickettsiales bacterium]
MRVSYVNGQYVPHHHASVAMEDRGYQFADGIYEVIVFFGRRLLDEKLHLQRLERSLGELGIAMPMSTQALSLIIRELMQRNAYRNGLIYMQVTRGVAPRNHIFSAALTPVLTMAVMPLKSPTASMLNHGVSAISQPDLRWGRCDIKSIGLLANSLAKNAAAKEKAYEALLVDANGMVTEGSATNAYMVKDGVVYTHPATHDILGGVRRIVLQRLCEETQTRFVERPFSLQEAQQADELFITSASSNVLPITTLDGKKIGSGTPGSVTKRLIELYAEHVTQQTGHLWN